jgi:integrase
MTHPSGIQNPTADVPKATSRRAVGRIGPLTPDEVRDAQPEKAKYRLPVGEPKALNLVVMPSGAKYWLLRYRWGGKAKDLSVGKPYPATSLAEARRKAKAMLAEIDKGIDPAERRKQDRLQRKEIAANTFGIAADAWHTFRSKQWSSRTADQARMYLDKDLIPALGRRPLESITTQELSILITAIADRGAPDVAKKIRQWLEAIFKYARGKGWTERNPVKDLHEITRHLGKSTNYPHLPLAKFPEFLKALDAIDSSPFVKGIINLVIWTGSRPGITRTLRWTELDLDQALWTIEAKREGMKRGYKHVVPLPRQAVEMLRALHPARSSFDYVFIGRNDPCKPISDGAANVLLKRMGYDGRQTVHGFRHLISTALNEHGYNSDWIERQLAHGDPDKIRAIYNKAMYLEDRRVMMQEWADELDSFRVHSEGV